MTSDPAPKTLLCLGYGYCAQALSRKLRAKGWRVIGTSRQAFTSEGVLCRVWPGDEISLDGVTHILHSIGPNAQGDPAFDAFGSQIAQLPSLQWMGYLSTTAVYGHRDGAWVCEKDTVAPTSTRGAWRAEAEAAWQSYENLPLHIFRLAGIYGPGRGPFSKLKAGKARRIVKDGQVFSRIHVDDITQILMASIERPNFGAIYNVCDDFPAPPQDVLGYAAELLNLPAPTEIPFEDAPMTPMARSFYEENKRVRNDRIKTELGVELLYPEYRAGLRAVRDAEENS